MSLPWFWRALVCHRRAWSRAHLVRRSPRFAARLFLASLALGVICVSCSMAGSGSGTSSPPQPSIAIQPSSAQPFLSSGVQFTAKVQNSSNSGVNWLVNQTPSGDSTVGTISSSGYYTAPAQTPGVPVTVTAVLQSDSSVSRRQMSQFKAHSPFRRFALESPHPKRLRCWSPPQEWSRTTWHGRSMACKTGALAVEPFRWAEPQQPMRLLSPLARMWSVRL